MGRYFALVLCLLPLRLLAQFTYVLDQSIPVTDIDDAPLPLAWSGGLNAAQYNTMDLDGDGKSDLVLFDRMANKVITYRNVNNQYVYSPEYEALFPAEITNWLLLRDYNCDGKKDIFTGDVLGIKVYTNVTPSGGQLEWQQFTFFVGDGLNESPVLLTKGFSGKINLQLQFDDLPSITDVDGDGDLDILSVKFTGAGTIEYHQNFSQERYGTCDSLDFERITQTWGNITECQCGIFAFNGNTCAQPSGGRTEHAGGKALLALDVDNDDDIDILFSEASCTRISLLRNEGTSTNPVFNNASEFPATNPINFVIFPAAYYEDVDFDGVRDLIATPNIFSKEFLNSDLRQSNWLYSNSGTDEAPSFALSKENLLQDQMIDVGDNAVPALMDYDGDGDWDMFIGQNSGNNFSASLYLYQNTGSNQQPAFKLVTRDFGGLSLFSYYNLKPQFADINGDNKVDLIFSATSFQTGATHLYYFANKSSSALDLSDGSINEVDFQFTFSENIHITDVDLDGLTDLLIGRNNGAVEYWKNSGPAGSLNYTLEENEFLGLGSSVLRQSPVVFTSDLDADGKSDLALGDQYGTLSIYSDYRNAGASAFTDFIFNPLLNTYGSGNLGGRLWPTAVTLFNTDKPELVVGTIMGGVRLLRHDDGKSLPDKPVVKIFPNPVEKSQTLSLSIDRFAYLQIYSSLGQELSLPTLLQPNQIYSYSVGTFPAGVYIARFYFNNKTYATRFVVY